MPDHLPTRPARPAPAALEDPGADRYYRRAGYSTVVVLGACLVCGTDGSTGWREAALDNLRHRHPEADVALGHVCADCAPIAEDRAAASRAEARRASTMRPIVR